MRRSTPRLFGVRYFALGDVDDEVRRNVTSYYSFGGPDFVERTNSSVLRTPDAIRSALDQLRDVGVEEVCLWPMSADPSQLHRLADAVL